MHEDIHRRLVSAKYILERASGIQVERTEMSMSISVLLMHDAVELLMLAVLDHVNAPSTPKREFKDFWSLVKQTTGKDAPDRIPMDRLNAIRVGMKHKGVMPNPNEARDLLGRVRGFFDNVLTLFCGESYDNISLLDIVPDVEVRKVLKEARGKFFGGDKDHAMVDLQVAFHKLRNPEDMVIPGLMAPRMPSLPSELRQARWDNYLQSIHSFMDASARITNALILGIDPLRYADFLNVGPALQWTMAGSYTAVFSRSYAAMTIETFDSLISFLVEYALKTSEVAKPKSARTQGDFVPHWEKFDGNR